jgi:transposase
LEEAIPEGALAPRCTKDRIEEALFARDRDLFSGLQLVFFDTTSIYFEGGGGETLGRYGHSKDHRKNRKQMVVGVVLDQEGRPICCELWPGNTTDVTTLVPVAERLRKRFGIGRVCLIADRGMVRKETLETLEATGWDYILGTRMRSTKEVRDEVLSRAGRFQKVFGGRTKSKDACERRPETAGFWRLNA